MNGFNPMRHNCESQGCFNLNRRPKIEVFSECFPRKIAMADVDGVVEMGGRFLFLEWKTPDAPISFGGKLTLSSFSRIPGSIAIAAWGDAKTMEVCKLMLWCGGRGYESPYLPSLEVLKQWMERWASFADKGQEFFACDIFHSQKQICHY